MTALSRIQQLAIAPSGSHIVVESGSGEIRTIDEIRLDDEDPEIRRSGGGWGVRFASSKDIYYYANYKGFFVVAVRRRASSMRPASWLP